jgi:hypothetical protein
VRRPAVLSAVAVAVALLLFAAARLLPERSAGRFAASGPAGALRCMPSELYLGETLTVALPAPRGPDLAVEDPAGRRFFLAFPGSRNPAAPTPPIGERAFRRMADVAIETAGLRLRPWGDAGTEQPVFSASGLYRVLLGRELRTLRPRVEESCEVLYVDEPRPAAPGPPPPESSGP